MRRVVITGCGIVSSLGMSKDAAFERLKTSRNCVSRSEELATYKGLQTCLWAPSHYVRPQTYTRKVIRTMSPVAEMALFATEQALAEAGLTDDPVLKGGRLGVAYGSCSGGVAANADFLSVLQNHEVRNVTSSTYIKMMPQTCAVNLSVHFGTTGRLIPTNTGLDIWRIFRDRKLADVRLTGEWERDLALVEQGKMDKAAFDDAICRFVEYVVDDIRTNCNPESISAFSETVHNCPICGKPMKNMKFSIICDPETDGCGFKIRREIAGKKLPASAIEALAAGKRTAVIKGFKSKSGKPFDCRLKVDRENGKVTYDFDEPPQVSAASAVCPCCGKPMTDEKWKLTCGCGFILYKSVGGVALTQEQIEKLLSGGSVSVYGMKNKAGKTYSAKLTVNPTGKKLDYEFINTPKKK